MNKRGSNDPLWPMNRHPDQTFREDVSHSEKEIPSSYLGVSQLFGGVGNPF